MQPVAQMVGVAPGQRPRTTGKDTAAVADGQGGALGGLDDPAGPPDLQRLGGRTPKDRWQQRHRGPQPPRQSGPLGCATAVMALALAPRGVAGGAWARGPWSWSASGRGCGRGRVGSGRLGRCGTGGWRVTRTRVMVPSQANRRHASGSKGPAQPSSPPKAPGRPSRLSRSTVTASWGRTPPVCGNRPASSARRANSARASAVRWLPLRVSWASAGGGPAAPTPPAASGRPRAPAARPRPPCRPGSGSATPPAAHGAPRRPARPPQGRRPAGDGQGPAAAAAGPAEPAASTRTGSASAVRWSGRSWVPWASTRHARPRWPRRSGRPRSGAAAPGTTPGRSAPSCWPPRRPAAAGPAARPAVDPTCWSCSAPAAPRPSTVASSFSQWPSNRSSSCRRTRTRSARTGSVSRSKSWAANPSTAAASTSRSSGGPAARLGD